MSLLKAKNIFSEANYPAEMKALNRAKIWAIGGGKGGVGKSLVTANVSICLALMGHKVICIDLDLGGANLHTCLGVPIPKYTLSDYLSKKVNKLEDILVTTPIKNLSIISGAQDELGMANLKQAHKSKLTNQFTQLKADYIIIDLGAGTTYNTLDFFIFADKGILTTLPEPTSIENTYRFIRSVFHRKLKMSGDFLEIGSLIDKALNSKVGSDLIPSEILLSIRSSHPELCLKLQEEISKLKLNLIINQVRTQSDSDIGNSMKIICKKYFGLDLDYIGFLEYDPSVWQSVKKRKPLLMEFPNSSLINNFDQIVHTLLNE